MPYPWALAETCECGVWGVGYTAGFDMSELQGSRRIIIILGVTRALRTRLRGRATGRVMVLGF